MLLVGSLNISLKGFYDHNKTLTVNVMRLFERGRLFNFLRNNQMFKTKL